MLERLKHSWHCLKQSEPGERFKREYHRHQETKHEQTRLKRALKMGGGVVIATGGIVLMPAPGPGWAIFFLGLGLLASEFLVVARFLDWLEVRLREGAMLAQRTWHSASLPGKILIGLIALACTAAVGYGLYYWFFGR